jgi:hypothetical protein
LSAIAFGLPLWPAVAQTVRNAFPKVLGWKDADSTATGVCHSDLPGRTSRLCGRYCGRRQSFFRLRWRPTQARPVSKTALPMVLFDLIGKLVPTHSRLKVDFLSYLVLHGFSQRFRYLCLAAIFFG